jgi:hypothetical protein
MELQKELKTMNACMQATVVTGVAGDKILEKVFEVVLHLTLFDRLQPDPQLSTAHMSARYGNAGPAMLCTTALRIPMPADILVERKRTFLDIPI